jgi:hypothetical protein
MNATPQAGLRSHGLAPAGVLLAALAMMLIPLAARGQVDHFNGNTDAGWTHYDPFASFGAPASFTVANGQYTISAPASPDPGQLGPSRAGSLRTDVQYTQFSISTDITDWDIDHDMALGILARVTNPGLGTTDGYALTYSSNGHSIDLSRVTGEQPHGLGSTTVGLDPNQTYRLVFTGNGPDLMGQVFDTADLTTPLASITGSDPTYTQGINGLVVFDNTNATSGTFGADGTFDNYAASVPEPLAATLLVLTCTVTRRRPPGGTGYQPVFS